MFHSKCDKIKGTLVIIKTIDNLKFGGYTSESWEGNNISKKDNKAFIVSLNLLKACDIKKDRKAIFCGPNCGPYFSGKDKYTFKIFDSCDTKGGECSKASESNYEGYINDYEFNNGNKKFQVSEMEVFKVNVE